MGNDAVRQSDVTVLGAGIVGVCCALSLQERGLSVTLVDRQAPGEATSYGNAGVISSWSCVPQCLPGVWKSVPGWLLDPKGPVRFRMKALPELLPWAARFFANSRPDRLNEIADAMFMMMRDNITIYRRFLKGTGHENLLIDSWSVHVFRENAVQQLSDIAWKLRIDRGAPVELVDRPGLHDIEPEVSSEFHGAVIVKDQARAYAPGRLCKVLAERALEQGAQYVEGEVIGIEPHETGGPTLHMQGRSVATNKLVLCGGIWSAELLKGLGLRVPLIAERGYHLEFENPGLSLNNSIFDLAGKFVVSSMEGGVRCAGTSEFAETGAPPNYQRAEVLKPLVQRLLPNLNTASAKRWMGVRPSFPDNLPAIGEVPGVPNLFAGFGHCHYGLGMAPVTGRIVADAVTGTASNINRTRVGIERFVGHAV